MAQTPGVAPTPPPYAPPPQSWPPPAAPGFGPAPPDYGTPALPPGGGGFYTPPPDDSYFVPAPAAPGFDYFEDEEEGGYGYGAPAGERKREVKDSFKLLERSGEPSCRKWGSALTGPATFADKADCEFELYRKVDQGKASIEELTDEIEFFKLKRVIRGELNREEGKKLSLSFDSLKRSLSDAARTGCSCQAK